MKIRVGSRDSRLAVIQSELVMEAIRAGDPGVELELVTMKTTGDKILDRTLDKIGGKGLFVRELAGRSSVGSRQLGFNRHILFSCHKLLLLLLRFWFG